MNEVNSVRNLLAQAKQVVRYNENTLKATGSGFSFIQALRLESDEARLHTRFIAYLLDPKEKHWQGDKFLQLFFDSLGIQEPTDGFRVETEKYVGKRDWESIEGGRIDILISNSTKKIAFAIELKVYAGEQEKQLQRYSNFLKEYYSHHSSKVYYLTLFGTKSQDSLCEYETLSFADNLFRWIEDCRQNSIDQPIIRETLSQYLASIKRLTNQNPDKKMNDEILDLITQSDESFKAFDALVKVPDELYNRYGDRLINRIKSLSILRGVFEIEFTRRTIPKLDSQISFKSPEMDGKVIKLYWLANRIVALGLTEGNETNQNLCNLLKEKLHKLNLGNYLDWPGWIWFCQIRELEHEPKLTYESWKQFGSQEFAEEVAGWVMTIYDAYQEVFKGDSMA